MEKLSKSFENLINDFPKITQWIENYQFFLAHTPKIRGQEAETLSEHIEKVNNYALMLANAHHLDIIIDNIVHTIVQNQQGFENKQIVAEFIKSLFIRAVIFHDYGKVNPNFQVLKMGNHKYFKEDRSIIISSHHSSLSAYIYIHFHIQKTLELDFLNPEERKFLWVLVFVFASPIFKHHSGFLIYTELPFTEDVYENLKRFLNDFKVESKMPLDNLFKENSLEKLLNEFSKQNIQVLSSVYYLLKLSFSLLTASDYYATFDYTSGNNTADLILKLDDFGLIEGDFRKRIIQNFKTTKVYNKALFEKTQELKNVPFADLQLQSKVNLNRLRQKLAAEVLSNLRDSPNDNLFYLEAPTGAGKTNISLAVAIELLERNPALNKIFYVFPFTTLVTQTFGVIKETLGIDNEHIIQLHAKSGFHQQNEEGNDGNYGENRMNFINNHFVNYPITLFTHIKFFDILKGNSKETNYIYHRLANSIVIIDELQSYNPKHWDKVIFFLSNYAQLFKMKIILMSATLPKIDNLLDEKSEMRGKVKYLLSKESKPQFFQNPNFAGRIKFDFSILDKFNWKRPKSTQEKEAYLDFVKEKLFSESEKYAQNNQQKADSIRTLIEFITKKTAFKFFKSLQEDPRFENYQLYLISGEILDLRRREIIEAIKENKDEKVILVTTQVVEAGVDIDMDLGFKDRSLIDSDEQLAGRVNRNASKQNCKVYMFDFDATTFIYKEDKRLKVDSMYRRDNYRSILKSKDFDTNFYDKVKDEILKLNESTSVQNLTDYLANFKRFNFYEIKNQFKLIDQDTGSIFVPLPIPKKHFDKEDLKVLEYFDITDFENENGIICINGKDVWGKYAEIIGLNKDRKGDYMQNQTKLKQIYGILSKFMFSAFTNQIKKLEEYFDNGKGFTNYEQFGLRYFSRWEDIYSYEGGLDMSKIDEDVFL